jgi:hypothetical protein
MDSLSLVASSPLSRFPEQPPVETMATMPFFNLLRAKPIEHDETYFGTAVSQTIATNWRTFQDQPLTSSTILDLFANRIPVIRHEGFLKPTELEKMLKIVKLHQLVIVFDPHQLMIEFKSLTERLGRI